MTAQSDSSSSSGSSASWLFKNKEHGKASAAASLVFIQSLAFLPDNNSKFASFVTLILGHKLDLY